MRPRLPSRLEVAPLPESVRWHLVTGQWPARGQFEDGWLAAFLLNEREKDELWSAHHAALGAEARVRGWRRGGEHARRAEDFEPESSVNESDDEPRRMSCRREKAQERER